MAIIQVAQDYEGKYVVQENGVTVSGLRFDTRGQAVKAAIDYKEAN